MNLHAHNTGQRDELDAIFASLSHHDRRRVLGRLYERAPETLTPRDLALTLCGQEREPSRAEIREARIRLVHAHLPKLEDAQLIEWDRASGVVRSAEHDVLRNTDIYDVLTEEQPVSVASLDALFSSLADHRRRMTLDLLDQRARPVELETLASQVRIVEVSDGQEPPASGEQVLTSLHHSHLPKLDASGLVSYESGERVVEYEGHPVFDSSDSLPSPVRSAGGD